MQPQQQQSGSDIAPSSTSSPNLTESATSLRRTSISGASIQWVNDTIKKNASIYTEEELAQQGVLLSRSLCLQCGKTTKRHTAAIRSHLLKHEIPAHWNVDIESGIALKCSDCDDVYKDSSTLRQHWEQVHGMDQDERGCFKCDLVFKNQVALSGHQRLVHSTRTQETRDLPRNWGKLHCKACGYVTTSLTDFLDHVDKKHGSSDQSCFVCNLTFADRQALNAHYHHVHDLPMHVCSICGKSFKTLPGYKNHIEIHGQVQECSLCDFKTSTSKNLEFHMKKYHSPTEENVVASNSGSAKRQLPFKCSICPASFLYDCLLTRHFHKTHLKLKPHKCPFCGHATTEKAALQTHIRCMHTDEMPYRCELCNFKCKTTSILSRHRKTHTGEKPHVCGECNAGFPEKRDLNTHYWKVHAKVCEFFIF